MSKRVYRMISSFTEEQSELGLNKISRFEIEKMVDLVNTEYVIDLKYDGNVCHWEDGELTYCILIITEEQIEFIKKLDLIIHEDFVGYTTFEDITEDVLYDRIDFSVFGFLETEMKFDFFKYRSDHLTKDDILDKILKYGRESLTENDKLFLNDKDMVSPLDEI